MLTCISRPKTGTSFSEDDFQPTEISIILSSLIRIVREYQPINIKLLYCLLITINNKAVSVGWGLATADLRTRELDTLQFPDVSFISTRWRERERERERERFYIWGNMNLTIPRVQIHNNPIKPSNVCYFHGFWFIINFSRLILQKLFYPVDWGCRKHRLFFCQGVTPPQRVS